MPKELDRDTKDTMYQVIKELQEGLASNDVDELLTVLDCRGNVTNLLRLIGKLYKQNYG